MSSAARKMLLLGSKKSWIEKFAILLDDFTSPEAAPLTSPRTAQPGPGLAAIADTNSLLSIADGYLIRSAGTGDDEFALGRNNSGSPAGQAITAGDAAFLDITPAATEATGWFGFDANTTQLPSEPYFEFSSGLLFRLGAGADPTIGTFTTARTKLLLVPRSATNGHFFIQDGKLLWVGDEAVVTPAYVVLASYNLTYSADRLALLPLSTYNPAWGGDFTEVLASDASPTDPEEYAVGTLETSGSCVFNINAGGSACFITPVFIDGQNYATIYNASGTAFAIGVKVANVLAVPVYTGSVFSLDSTHAVSWQVEDNLLHVWVDGVLQSGSGVDVSALSASVTVRSETDTAGSTITDLAVNAIDLGIATSRLLHPANPQQQAHDTECLIHWEDVELPPGAEWRTGNFFYEDADNRLYVALNGDGQIGLTVMSDIIGDTSPIYAVAGTVSEGDDIVVRVWLAGSTYYAALFVAGVQVGSNTDLTAFIAAHSARVVDHNYPIACASCTAHPVDLKPLLPGGTY